jgi:hypothetical protein
MELISLHAVPSVALLSGRPAFMGGLSPVPYWLAVLDRKRHKFRRRQNIGVCLNFTIFHRTVAADISVPRHPIKKP